MNERMNERVSKCGIVDRSRMISTHGAHTQEACHTNPCYWTTYDDMTGPVAELEMTLSLHSEPAQDQRRATNAGFVWLKAFGRHELRRSEAKRS